MPPASTPQLTIGQCATLACLLEVTVPKPGNVHRGADFEDATFLDFVISAVAIGPAMENARQIGIGAAVLSAVRETRRNVATNTNLGTILLLAPLAAAVREESLQQAIGEVLDSLSPPDAVSIYRAIQLANPGGIGEVADMDVAGQPPRSILDAMQAAAEHDLVARQYTSRFATVLDEVVPLLASGSGRGWTLADTIIQTQLILMSRYPDSLIARKCGPQIAQESAARAAGVLESGAPGSDVYFEKLAGFDFWLRSNHHRRNPGTTADLIAAGLFVALRDELIAPPYR
jgi:triphosphoribosyl-dephospho-CoA synthase